MLSKVSGSLRDLCLKEIMYINRREQDSDQIFHGYLEIVQKYPPMSEDTQAEVYTYLLNRCLKFNYLELVS